MTCFITSIGHGEPAMTPYNEELQKITLITWKLAQQALVNHNKNVDFQPIRCRQNSTEYNCFLTSRKFPALAIGVADPEKSREQFLV